MLEIERINMAYNKDTNFGQNPNGRESEIKTLVSELDTLRNLRRKLKEPIDPRVQVEVDDNGRPLFPEY
jgi:hypothetical protein